MKIVKSWDAKYIGIKIKDMVYYLAWNHPTCRDWGYENFWHDGPIKRISAYFISFQWHYDYNHD